MLSDFTFREIIDCVKIPLIALKPMFNNGVAEDFEVLYVNLEFSRIIANLKTGTTLTCAVSMLENGMHWLEMAQKAVETKELFAETYYSEKKQAWFSFELQTATDKLVVATLTDITAKVSYTEQLKLSLVTDTLTTLPNRFQFYKKFQSVVDEADQTSTKFGLISFDLDNLKQINDSKGQQAGDRLLIKAARIFKSFENKNIDVYRFGGDEFILVAKNLSLADSLYTISDAVMEALNSENVNASGGISVYPDNTSEKEDLVKFADLAMHDAKKAGKNRVLMFTPELQKEFLRRMMYKTKMPAAFDNGEFELFFQPQFDISSNELRGFEALLRWNEPELGKISPEDFIPVAEESGFIKILGAWVLKKAFTCQRDWEEKFAYKGVMSVNVSPVQLMDDDFLFTLDQIARESGVEPTHVEIEVTEGVLIDDTDKAVAVLDEVKRRGFRISLDDFGTGYSSLRYLQILPLTTLKIDKSFIQSITEKNGVSENITNSIISMVTKMGLDTIAEGVEKVDQLKILQELNCKTVQGFLRGKPMSQAAIEEYLSGNINALDYIKE